MIRCSARPARVRRYSVRLPRGPPLDHARLLQPAEALGEQRARDAGQAALELVEVADVGQELAHDQHRPAIGEDLGRARHRTVLAV
jgi:hypothetical protein